MSRSRGPKCGTGRGCWACGDQGQVRRAREDERAAADLDPVAPYGLEQWNERDYDCWLDSDENEHEPIGEPPELRVALGEVAHLRAA